MKRAKEKHQRCKCVTGCKHLLTLPLQAELERTKDELGTAKRQMEEAKAGLENERSEGEASELVHQLIKEELTTCKNDLIAAQAGLLALQLLVLCVEEV